MALVLGAVPTLTSWCCFSGWDFKKSSWKDEEIGPGHCWGGKSGPLVSGVLTWNPPNPAKVAVSVCGGGGGQSRRVRMRAGKPGAGCPPEA